ncbi:MAG: hypothetical protein EPN33_10400 [Acidobacteria bacterium]|nr:MAG: hypothetical protein EPN33_10400 [Acidobacteriota bacterium]
MITVTLSGNWATVPLPDMPLGITVHDGAFWVCGAHEMIARSRDGGRTWQILHEKTGGQMLFTLAFTGAGTVQAFGTSGVRVLSVDSGQHWKRSWTAPGRAFNEVRFANAQIGYGFGPGGFAKTRDGGQSWTFWCIHQKKEQGAVVAMTVSDANNALFLTADNHLVMTSNGGRTWQDMPFGGKANWTGLGAAAGKYRLFGSWDGAIPRILRGSRTSPATSASPWEPYKCNPQGCLVSDGWADLNGGHWAWPEDTAHPLTGKWGVVGDGACRVSDVLRCRVGRRTALSPPPPAAKAASSGPHPLCVHCPDPPFPPCRALRALRTCVGSVLLRCLIGTDGRVHAIILVGAQGAGLAGAAMQAVRKWRYSMPKSTGSKGMIGLITVTYHAPHTNVF